MSGKIAIRRFINTAQVSWMLTYQSVLYFIMVRAFGALGLDKALRYWQADLEGLMSSITGGYCC